MIERTYWPEILPENSPEYTKEKAKNRNRVRAWGEYFVSNYRGQQKVLASAREGKNQYFTEEEVLKQLVEGVNSRREEFVEFLSNKKEHFVTSAQNFLQESLNEPQMKVNLSRELGKEDLTLEDIRQGIIDKTISDELFIEMIECHVKIFREKARDFEIEAKQWKQEFKDRAREEVERGFLPISLEALERRVDETTPFLADPLETPTIGQYTDWGVSINDVVPQERRRHSIFHELTHAISGRIPTVYEESKFRIVEHGKLGLRFQVRVKGSVFPTSRFEWLSEAITETVALQLSGEQDRQYYIMERATLNTLTGHLSKDRSFSSQVKTVPLEVFIKAYFEDFDGESETDIVPAFREMWEEVDIIMGDGTMARLEAENG